MIRSFNASLLVIGLAAGTLGACAMDDSAMMQTNWNKANVTQAQAMADKTQCNDMAAGTGMTQRPDAMTASPFPGGGTPTVSYDSAREHAAFDQCMLGRGYMKVQ